MGVHKKKQHRFTRILRTGLVLLCVFAAICLAVLTFWFRPYVSRVFESIGDIDLDAYGLDRSSELLAFDPETEEWYCYATLHADENRIEISLEDMPEDLLDACVAIEDKRFWTHKGVDWMRTAYAAANMIMGGRVRFGASTITQQLIKNLTGDDEVTTDRKLREICSALVVEQKYSKEEILCRYLNTVYFGHGFWGVEAASRGYYGKSASELTASEAASLIAITRNPSMYDPYEGDKNRTRRLDILYEMHEQGYLTDSEYAQVQTEEPRFLASLNAGYYSWFTDEVIRSVQRDLIAGGYSEEEAVQLIYCGGLKIYTTVDPACQEMIDKICSNRGELPVTSAGDDLQGGVIVIDNMTGNIIGISGGFGEKQGSLVLDRATQSLLQPASALKPLSTYAPGLESGLIDPWTILEDRVVWEAGMGNWPANAYHEYLGNITVDEAVRRSTNTIPVLLVKDMGEEACLDILSKFGLDLEDESYVRLALGGLNTGVSVKDMAAAYAAICNHGVYRSPWVYTRVETSDGTAVLDREQVMRQVISGETAAQLTSMLEDVAVSGTGIGSAVDGIATAVKTGTSDDGKDYWLCGYTPYYTIAVWCGTDDPEVITTDGGMNPALEVWSRIANAIHEGLDPAEFAIPESLGEVRYCLCTGWQASENCVATGVTYASDRPVGVCDGSCAG